ncbi:MAG: hypothetical protein V1753_01160 [Pseudomonadota bacterium]
MKREPVEPKGSGKGFCSAPVDEVMAVVDRYEGGYRGWNVRRFYS